MGTKKPTIAETQQDQLNALDRLASQDLPANFDLRGQKIEILDVRYPTTISSTLPGLRSKLDWTKSLFMDRAQSIYGLRRAYTIGLLPPPKPSILSTLRLVSPALSSSALSLYTQMNDSFVRGDLRTLENACSDEQFDKLRQGIRARPKGQVIAWKIDTDASRADILSVRCKDVWGAKRVEDHCVHALMRFDTRQSIAVYGLGGKLVSGDPNKTVRVREHFILEKKNWDGSPKWTIRKFNKSAFT